MVEAQQAFIVDNSDSQWTVKDYLRECCEIATSIDVATGYFEIGGLLALDGAWQKLDGLRLLMGDSVTIHARDAFARARQAAENRPLRLSVVSGIQTSRVGYRFETSQAKGDSLSGSWPRQAA